MKRVSEKRNSYRVLFGNPKKWNPLGICSSENIIKTSIKEKGGKVMDLFFYFCIKKSGRLL